MPARKSQTRAEADKRIQKALDELANDKHQSIRAAAKANNVSHTTLLRRLDGGKSTAESREPQQILTIAEEDALAECITRLATVGHPPKHAFIRELAEEIQSTRLRNENDPHNIPAFRLPIGDSWVQRFIHRHFDLETAFSRTIEAARVKEVTKEALDHWFEELKKTIEEKKIRIDDMYNMDETGFSIGSVRDSHVVVSKTSKTRFQAHPGRQEWASVLECICADGGSIVPFIILKGDKVLGSWIPPSALELDWYFAASIKGWTNNDRGFEWLTKVFDPLTREKVEGRTRLLICDGHDSHISVKFVAHCIENDICLFLLLPHSSHLLQPLDVGVFNPLKIAVTADLDRLIRVGVARLEKVEWVESYIRARPKALTEKNIRAGWRHSGLVPLNRNRHSAPDSSTSQTMNSTTPIIEDLLINTASLDIASLDTINSKLSELAIKDAINTPIRRAIPKVLSRNNQALAENVILKRRLADIEKIVCARQERKNGKRNVLKGKSVISTPEILEELKKCEELANLRKKKRGSKTRKTGKAVIQEHESSSEDDEETVEVELLDVIEVASLRG
jgi:hypothetical protein